LRRNKTVKGFDTNHLPQPAGLVIPQGYAFMPRLWPLL
jgi:hypothetical protein